MKAISIRKTEQLRGSVTIQGSKNTVLPVMAATLLSSGVSVIYNCPMIEDVVIMCKLLECLHAKTKLEDRVLTIDTREVSYEPLPYELTTKLRSSVLLLGPILARWKKVQIGVPGGCAIGLRPIDIHLDGLAKMNVNVACRDGILTGSTSHLQGCDYHLRFASVGATENLVMAATVATGRTILRGVAKETEIIELCNYLISMGALIEGVGTDTLIIKGTGMLSAVDYCNVYDRIVAGTYMLMAAAIPSDICLLGIDDIGSIKNIINIAVRLGVNVLRYDNCLKLQSVGRVQGGIFQTGIFPEFPTDLLPVLISVLIQSEDDSVVEETIFENRFSIIGELKKMGASLCVEGNRVFVQGGKCLQGRTVLATDLRQGAALALAGMLGKGYTTITSISYIQRGYENIVRDLSALGVQIEYV